MGMNGDWKELSKGADVEIKVEPITNSEDVIVAWSKRYRTVTQKTVMETFSNVANLPDPVIEPPVTNEFKIISDNYQVTQKETDSGEHTITRQKISSWSAF